MEQSGCRRDAAMCSDSLHRFTRCISKLPGHPPSGWIPLGDELVPRKFSPMWVDDQKQECIVRWMSHQNRAFLLVTRVAANLDQGFRRSGGWGIYCKVWWHRWMYTAPGLLTSDLTMALSGLGAQCSRWIRGIAGRMGADLDRALRRRRTLTRTRWDGPKLQFWMVRNWQEMFQTSNIARGQSHLVLYVIARRAKLLSSRFWGDLNIPSFTGSGVKKKEWASLRTRKCISTWTVFLFFLLCQADVVSVDSAKQCGYPVRRI
jgi:hypothetical protein